MTVGGAFRYVVANALLFAMLAWGSGRTGASAASVALVNAYILLVRRLGGRAGSMPEEELVHVLSALAVMLQRKRTFPEALAAGALAAGPRLGEAIDGMAHKLRLGTPIDQAMREASVPEAEPAFSSALWAIAFGLETGAPLPLILDRIATSLAHQLELKRQFQVLALHGRLSALVLSALPVLLLALLLPFRPDMFGFLAAAKWGPPLAIALILCWGIGLRIILEVSGSWPGVAARRLDTVDEELPILVDLVAEGLDLGMEPRGLLERLTLKARPGPLRELLERVLARAALGVPLAEALRSADAAGSRAFLRFALAMANTGSGPGSGHMLRFQAREMRMARYHRLAMEAQRAPFLLLLALVFLVFPLTFGLLLVPFVARVASVLGR